MAEQKIACAVPQVHAVALAIAEPPALGAFAFFHP